LKKLKIIIIIIYAKVTHVLQYLGVRTNEPHIAPKKKNKTKPCTITIGTICKVHTRHNQDPHGTKETAN
jgi:hypothetical protein